MARRKPQMTVPGPVVETRKAAITVGDEPFFNAVVEISHAGELQGSLINIRGWTARAEFTHELARKAVTDGYAGIRLEDGRWGTAKVVGSHYPIFPPTETATVIMDGLGPLFRERAAHQLKSSSGEYLDMAFCPVCEQETQHVFRDSGHERDSSGDFRECKKCQRFQVGHGDHVQPYVD